jgi:hypothetical protein
MCFEVGMGMTFMQRWSCIAYLARALICSGSILDCGLLALKHAASNHFAQICVYP